MEMLELLGVPLEIIQSALIGMGRTVLEHPWGMATSPIWAFPVTWVLFIFVMGLKKEIKRQGGWTAMSRTRQLCYALLGGPFAVVGLLLDYYVNFVVMTPLLMQPPKFYTGKWHINGVDIPYAWPRLTTARLSDHYGKEGYRGKVCTGICDIFLHPWDENHCGRR